MSVAIAQLISNPQFPCVMAKSVLSQGHLVQHDFSENDPAQVAPQLKSKIYDFIDQFRTQPKRLSSFIVSFDHPELKNFERCEEFFWNLLRELHQLDSGLYPHDPRVASDPQDPRFSFSLKSEAFFILMLHPQSPRFARRSKVPTIVFNAHSQFEDLRQKGLFQKIRDLIRKRDAKLQGSVNPMLADHGADRTEIFQYTGREYSVGSKCPFQRAKTFLLG